MSMYYGYFPLQVTRGLVIHSSTATRFPPAPLFPRECVEYLTQRVSSRVFLADLGITAGY